MHIYAFGSLCRGEIDQRSDVDLLAVVGEGTDEFLSTKIFSIYSERRIKEIWKEGNPFAWHLATESRLIYSGSGMDFIKNLGQPAKYKNTAEDCGKFYELFVSSKDELASNADSFVFELSNIFLSIRNFATCFALGFLGVMEFSRRSALNIGAYKLQIEPMQFNILERARVLSTRGIGESLSMDELKLACDCVTEIQGWMDQLMREVEGDGA